MANDAAKASRLKDEGNKCFVVGNFVGAESLYSKAIIADCTSHSLYSNRAMARLRLGLFDSALTDCHACLKLSNDNMKAYFILSQCQLAIRDFASALESAKRAHKLCVEINDKSLEAVTAQVLRCKKELWDEAEKKRHREGQELENYTVDLLERERDESVAKCATELDRQEMKEECDKKINMLREIFERARAASEKKREVPDWAIDDITFGFMVDPVITKNGKSYERSSIMEHLRRHPSDPLTREPLRPSELRPNIALKQACEEFLEHNGWAADW